MACLPALCIDQVVVRGSADRLFAAIAFGGQPRAESEMPKWIALQKLRAISRCRTGPCQEVYRTHHSLKAEVACHLLRSIEICSWASNMACKATIGNGCCPGTQPLEATLCTVAGLDQRVSAVSTLKHSDAGSAGC